MKMYALVSGESLDRLEPLRTTLFSRPIPLSVGDAAVIDPARCILLAQRADDHEWTMPGGALEVGEAPAAGVIREAFEETGVCCQAVAPVGVHDSWLCGLISRHQMYAFLFLCRPIGNIQPHFECEETLDTDWFAEDALPEAMHPGVLSRIPEAFRVWRGDPSAYFDK